jgi:hypothetical protein
MFLPAQYAWFEPVLVAAVIVFLVDFAGSVIVFSRRPTLNALASAILFAIGFGVLVYYGYGTIDVSLSTTPSPNAPVHSAQASTPESSTAR